ncbi:uncharacterized protein FA14DRAFT_175179 [Meira miltonrushii]|uniref:Uncharacterized protein n=1 Tax=Meira miltonrushii TaxID=1280837 RepID=A0A316V7A3_9BASI|nr:uncharacterized protein FA14DRAFT_175179 [Meira miltonrushii]PWN32381.1 hypothetical protein FA14DRAFT_175179 [Meira miltonrushii]
MKWTQLTVIMSLVFQQACIVQVNMTPLPKVSSLGYDAEEKVRLEDDEGGASEVSTINVMMRKPAHRFYSNLYSSKLSPKPKKMRKMIKIENKDFVYDIEEEGKDMDQAIVLQKRELNGHTGAIVPYKGGGAIVPHKGGGAVVPHQGGGGNAGSTARKGFGKGAKVVAGVGGAIALGGVVAGAVGLAKHKNKRSQDGEEVQFVKRD